MTRKALNGSSDSAGRQRKPAAPSNGRPTDTRGVSIPAWRDLRVMESSVFQLWAFPAGRYPARWIGATDRLLSQSYFFGLFQHEAHTDAGGPGFY